MGPKMAVAFANIFMAKVETKILIQFNWPLVGNDSLMTSSPSGTQPEKRSHSSLNNTRHQTIKFTNFLDTTVYKHERFKT